MVKYIFLLILLSLTSLSPAYLLSIFESAHVLLEAGCGVGNFIFPFLADFPSWTGYACDFSPRAVDFVKVIDIDTCKLY